MPPFAFVSYSRDDSDFALRLTRDLKDVGVAVWLDTLEIPAGQRWDRTIQDSLAKCSRMLFVLSASSVKSENVMDEVYFALDNNKTVIPVLYRDCDIPFRVRRLQYIDFRADYDRGFRALVQTLQGELPAQQGVSTPLEAPQEHDHPATRERNARGEPHPVVTPTGGGSLHFWSGKKTIAAVGAALMAALVLYGVTVWSRSDRPPGEGKSMAPSSGPAAANEGNLPILQSVIAKPNSVTKGDRVALTVQIDRAAPRGGASVALTSSDPAILTVDGNAFIPEGGTMGTGYSQAVDVPNYLSPVQVSAVYGGQTRQTGVNVTKPQPDTAVPRTPAIKPAPSPTVTSNSAPPPPKPAPLDAELLGRLEDAQGRLAAEKNYWGNVQRNMVPGTSLRPEISSQIFAAESASQRCSNDKQASDAASLKSCVDALNDHLTQLKIQH